MRIGFRFHADMGPQRTRMALALLGAGTACHALTHISAFSHAPQSLGLASADDGAAAVHRLAEAGHRLAGNADQANRHYRAAVRGEALAGNTVEGMGRAAMQLRGGSDAAVERYGNTVRVMWDVRELSERVRTGLSELLDGKLTAGAAKHFSKAAWRDGSKVERVTDFLQADGP